MEWLQMRLRPLAEDASEEEGDERVMEEVEGSGGSDI